MTPPREWRICAALLLSTAHASFLNAPQPGMPATHLQQVATDTTPSPRDMAQFVSRQLFDKVLHRVDLTGKQTKSDANAVALQDVEPLLRPKPAPQLADIADDTTALSKFQDELRRRERGGGVAEEEHEEEVAVEETVLNEKEESTATQLPTTTDGSIVNSIMTFVEADVPVLPQPPQMEQETIPEKTIIEVQEADDDDDDDDAIEETTETPPIEVQEDDDDDEEELPAAEEPSPDEHMEMEPAESIAEARRQPKSPQEEAALAAKYAAIDSLEDRMFTILQDLGMVGLHDAEPELLVVEDDGIDDTDDDDTGDDDTGDEDGIDVLDTTPEQAAEEAADEPQLASADLAAPEIVTPKPLEVVYEPPPVASLPPRLTQQEIQEARRQPKSPEEEAVLAAKYAAIDSLEDRVFAILQDLGMVAVQEALEPTPSNTAQPGFTAVSYAASTREASIPVPATQLQATAVTSESLETSHPPSLLQKIRPKRVVTGLKHFVSRSRDPLHLSPISKTVRLRNRMLDTLAIVWGKFKSVPGVRVDVDVDHRINADLGYLPRCIREARQQPKSVEKELALAQKYASIDDLSDRAAVILDDLGMI